MFIVYVKSKLGLFYRCLFYDLNDAIFQATYFYHKFLKDDEEDFITSCLVFELELEFSDDNDYYCFNVNIIKDFMLEEES